MCVRFALEKMETCSHLYFGFDRYQEYSVKSGTRSSRSTKSSRQYRLALKIPLPPHTVILTGSKNKVQLMNPIHTELIKTVQDKNHPTFAVTTVKLVMIA